MRWGAAGALLGIVGVMAAAVGGCDSDGPPDSSCPGYLGCVSGESVGVAPVPPTPPKVDPNIVLRGAGCGKPLPADQPVTTPGQDGGYRLFTVMTTGATLAGPKPTEATSRSFWVRVPADYDPQTAYRVVYIGGEYGSTLPTDVYPLFDQTKGGTEEAIYVAMTVTNDMAGTDGYDEDDGLSSYEWEAFQLIQSAIDDTYCVDNNRIFAVGDHPGGFVADMWGCYFAGDGYRPASDPAMPRMFARQYSLRGEGSVSSGAAPDNPPCNGPVAGLWIHDTTDGAVPISLAYAARDRVLGIDGCMGSPTAPWHNEVTGLETCVQYTACPADYPVVFCQTSGLGHAEQPSAAVPALTLLFNQLNPQLNPPP